ncbi:bifunctional DNA primase/polymerase [Dictyobacter aurantiacus]|uniref:DNA primase/polymerase bifunctional N-terminal domain-containing protein n=1 Tax=Dictyobacter aurantiacus TaxID=1936993 RepID=A0A401ZQU5_9CHLR|nr:bifunctional DNA primase/polymerase [Dictyobacter aurantiacus]GCE09202.1 hypothetical protein KDAU_65310 [Dictyobacter aurantiacus]
MMRVSSESLSSLNVYQTALVALRAGISCIPILTDGTKSPAVRWKAFQYRLPTSGQARQWFYDHQYGIAFITGQVSGGLEMLDFDDVLIYQQFVERVREEGLHPLLERIERGYTEWSPKGVHLYYRTPLLSGGSIKVAQRPINEPPYVVSLIETRGEGGYSIGAPSHGTVHPSGLPYVVQRGHLTTIQTIQPEDRTLLLAVARTLDEIPPSYRTSSQKGLRPQKQSQQRTERRQPGTIFNERATWSDILVPHGWTWVRTIGKEDFWRRPGKTSGISATTNYRGSGYLYVFSTSTLFEPRVGISKFAAYTFLEHGGDFSLATKALVEQGYVDEDLPIPFSDYSSFS